MARILCAGDNELERRDLAALFGRAGWDVDLVSTGEQAIEVLCSTAYAVAVVDCSLPGLSGLDVCRQLRHAGSTIGVVALSGGVDASTKHLAFVAGADDCVAKPFHPQELCDRVSALLRRSSWNVRFGSVGGQDERVDTVVWGPFSLRSGEILHIDGRECELTPRQRSAFTRLLRNAGRVVTNADIWADFRAARPPDPTNIRALMYSLRKRLGEAANYIEPVRGVGYRMRAPSIDSHNDRFVSTKNEEKITWLTTVADAH